MGPIQKFNEYLSNLDCPEIKVEFAPTGYVEFFGSMPVCEVSVKGDFEKFDNESDRDFLQAVMSPASHYRSPFWDVRYLLWYQHFNPIGVGPIHNFNQYLAALEGAKIEVEFAPKGHLIRCDKSVVAAVKVTTDDYRKPFRDEVDFRISQAVLRTLLSRFTRKSSTYLIYF